MLEYIDYPTLYKYNTKLSFHFFFSCSRQLLHNRIGNKEIKNLKNSLMIMITERNRLLRSCLRNQKNEQNYESSQLAEAWINEKNKTRKVQNKTQPSRPFRPPSRSCLDGEKIHREERRNWDILEKMICARNEQF